MHCLIYNVQPYQCLADSESSPVVVDKEEINRIFLNQTIHERNTSLGTSMGIQIIWLRTCYDRTLTAKYNTLKRAAGAGISDCMTKVLDDATRYNFEESWRRILICIPGLTDLYGIVDMDGDGSNLQYKSGQDDIELVAQVEGEDEDCRELSLVELRIQAGIYLLDKEAIESGFIKVVWIDEHGDCVWDNRLDPVVSDVEGLAGALMNSTSLIEITGYNGTRGALIER
ncbi:hypothetical protein N7522_011520 [Penicillium canescens]|uniref:Uncharacterized protein n=1 Tax=Penicillium canescens TaxID=5083 RepID=A0AAD6NEA8_PENCN|nr:hypothetical protein N7522_011520 [Penicillium canescens]KAJ6049428.1 hypothetical protein N7444_006144 [Penicillium canescens]KAJ6052602.1 hypothetical protein N7460_003136 [Penicillium canescens]